MTDISWSDARPDPLWLLHCSTAWAEDAVRLFPISIVTLALAWLIVAILVLAAALQAFVLWRRHVRARYFRAKDGARARMARAVDSYLHAGMDLPTLLRHLGPMEAAAERDALSELAGSDRDPRTADRRSRLLWRTGHVHRWAVTAFGKASAASLVKRAFGNCAGAASAHFLRGSRLRIWWASRISSAPRALALHELGRLSPEIAHVFLEHALHDPSVVVRRLAIESMGENHSPLSIPCLLEELRRAVEEGNDVSLRTIKSALVRYRVMDMDPFLPFFTHPTQRMRFFVIDTLREICHRASQGRLLGEEAFSHAMREVVLHRCCRDEFADVRARAAGVIRHFLDSDAVRALHLLLQDDNEFVRLHAVRACGHAFYRPLIPDLLLRVTDVRWRVREAAVRALIALAPQGLTELYHFFASSRDKYACEQISEELQCRGLIRGLVRELAGNGAGATLAFSVCRKLVLMGYTSMLITELGKVTRADLEISFTEALRFAPPEELIAVLREVSAPRPEAEHAGALQLLYRHPAPRLEAQGTV